MEKKSRAGSTSGTSYTRVDTAFVNVYSGALNQTLHDLEEFIYSGDFAREHATKLPESFTPTLRAWPKNKKTEPYQM